MSCIHAKAQSFNVSFKHISADDVLPENHVKCFFRDSIGFVWMGTRNGLVRFDGLNMKTFQNTVNDTAGLKGYNVNNIVKDKEGNLWVGTDYGVNFYNVHTNAFRNFPLIPQQGDSSKGMCYSVPLAVDNNGMLWVFVSTRWGLYTLNPHTGSLRRMPCKADLECGIRSVAAPGKIDMLGFRLLHGVVLYDVYNYKLSTGREYFAPGGRCPELIINEAKVYFGGNDSIAWITCDQGLIKLNYKRDSYKLFNNFNNNTIGKTADICFYNNLMFVASAYNGLFVFNPLKDTFTGLIANNPFDPNSLLSNKLSKLFVAGNTLFVAFDAGGLDFTNLKNVFTHYLSMQDVAPLGIKNQVGSICGLNNAEVLLGTAENGVIVYNPSAGGINIAATVAITKRLPARQINNIASNSIYTAVSSNEGLYVYKSNLANSQKIPPVIKGGVNYVAFFNDTVLLATTNEGLYQINIRAAGFTAKPVEDYNNEHNFMSLAIYPVKGQNVVYVMAEYGAYLHEIVFSNNAFHIKRTTWLTQDNNFITHGSNDSELLLCGPHGIIRFNRKSFAFSTIGGQPFSNQQVSAMLQLKNGNWFVAYNKGVAVYDATLTRQLALLDQSDGLYNTWFFPNACTVLNNGDVMLGTNDGIFIYHAQYSALAMAQMPPIYIADIKVNDGPYNFKKEVNYIDNIQLRYDENTVSFSFSAVDFSPSPKKKLEYEMKGIDKAWIPAQLNGFARYAGLVPGEYTFMVRNYGDKASVGYKKIVINIGRPFWDEWWFILSCFVLFFVVVYLIYLYRIQELIRLRRVRNKIATDLHDDIGSTLTNISILAELSYSNIQNSGKASEFIRRISEEVSATSESLDDIVWSINTNNDSFSEMAARMRRYASDIFEQGDVKWEVRFDEHLAGKKIKMDQRRDIYLIFKEAFNNIYKHAGAKNVKVSLSLHKSEMVMRIQDDGKGFDVTRQTGRNGLKNMQIRAKKWRGDCNIQSSHKGTLITIRLAVL